MNRSVRRLSLIVAVVLAAAGCRRKEADTEVADEAESALPKTEQVTPPAKDEAAPAPVADETSPPRAAAGSADFAAWFKKYGLDLNDPKMLDADPDGDGFTNREEFLADTNPLDPNDYPGVHKKIRLKEFTEVRLPLIVESVEGDKARLRRTDAEAKPETVKAGDMLHGLPLKVEKVEEIHDTDKEGHSIDRSIVVLEDSGSKEKLTLVKDMPARTAASFAVLTSPDGASTMKVKQGDIFLWPGETGSGYKVVDLREDQIVIQEVDNKKVWTVRRLVPAKTP